MNELTVPHASSASQRFAINAQDLNVNCRGLPRTVGLNTDFSLGAPAVLFAC